MHALVLERRACYHRDKLQLKCSLAQRPANLRRGNLLGFDVLVHQIVIDCGHCFDQFIVRGLCAVLQLGGNLDGLVLCPLGLIVPDQPLHRDQIDHALKLIFNANGNLEGNGICAEASND